MHWISSVPETTDKSVVAIHIHVRPAIRTHGLGNGQGSGFGEAWGKYITLNTYLGNAHST